VAWNDKTVEGIKRVGNEAAKWTKKGGGHGEKELAKPPTAICACLAAIKPPSYYRERDYHRESATEIEIIRKSRGAGRLAEYTCSRSLFRVSEEAAGTQKAPQNPGIYEGSDLRSENRSGEGETPCESPCAPQRDSATPAQRESDIN